MVRLEFLELLNGVEIDGADAFELLTKFIHDLHHERPVGLCLFAGNDDIVDVHLVIVAIGDGADLRGFFLLGNFGGFGSPWSVGHV